MDLVCALSADGTVAVVGAGGKTSAMYALAARLDRAVVTATVRIPPFEGHVADLVVTDDPRAAVASAREWPLGVVPRRDRPDRYLGYDPGMVAGLADADVDAVLVKADGARNRLFKAPGDGEPRIPETADVVIPVASVHAVGEPLSPEAVHRVERVADLTGLDPGDTIRPADVAAVLASPGGGFKGVPPDATVIPLLNMVDDGDLERTAREVARGVHARADVPRVVLTRLLDDEPIVGVV